MATEDIFGPDLGSLKGGIPEKKTTHVEENHCPISSTIMEKYWNVVLCVDIMYNNNFPFLFTISWSGEFIISGVFKKRQIQTIIKRIQKV